MRTALMNTTALALFGAMSLPVSAAEWNVRVGGYMEQYVAFASSDADFSGEYDGIDTKQDVEIHFLPSITLDNGIKIGANVQLEGNTSSDQIDESYMFINGSFGEVLLGSTNSAGNKMTVVAPDVTFLEVNSGSLTMFIPFSGSAGGVSVGDDFFRGTLGTTFLENVANNDAQRITYFTPRFSGFQVGASYARDGRQDSSGPVDRDSELSDIFDVGANYVQSFGDMDVALSGRWGIANDNSGADPQVWSVGANIGFSGFTIGGSYGEQNGSSSQRLNGEAWDAGVSYETGPWGFSFTYMHGKNQDNENGPNDDEVLQQFLVGVAYKLAKGVVINGYGAYVDFDEDVSDGGGGNGDDVDGFVIGTAIKISF
jgi:outer membrane protein OmpU